MAEPADAQPADAACDGGRGAQPADAHEGVRQIGQAEEAHPAADHGGMMRFFLYIFLGIISLSAGAQGTYPNKPIRVIVPFSPGGASDFVARLMPPRLTELLGQPIVVENKPGAAGNIGVDAAAKSAPDGYTVFLGNVGSLAINPSALQKAPATPTRHL